MEGNSGALVVVALRMGFTVSVQGGMLVGVEQARSFVIAPSRLFGRWKRERKLVEEGVWSYTRPSRRSGGLGEIA